MLTKREEFNTIRKAQLSDLGHLAKNLRPEDADEIRAHSGFSVPAALSHCWSYGNPHVGVSPYTGNPVVIFGVVPSEEHPGAGIVWMLATTELKDCQMAFLRRNHEFLPVLHKDFDTLYNYLDARNELHLKWCKWLGFTVLRLVPEYGFEQRPFYEIARIQSSCASSQQARV